MSKSMFFVFYKEDDYLSDRLHILYNRVNPAGIWKFINIYKDSILVKLPINLYSLPAIYNVKKKELYEGEYVFEFLRSFDLIEYNKLQKQINETMNMRNDSEINNLIQIEPPRMSREQMEYQYLQEQNRYGQGSMSQQNQGNDQFNPSIQNVSGINYNQNNNQETFGIQRENFYSM